jgi:hypothetical protein
MAKSYNFGDSDRKIQSASKGENSEFSGTPVLNLLNEFKAISTQDEEQKTSSFNPNITQTSTNTSAGFNIGQVQIPPLLHPSVPNQERIFQVPSSLEFEMSAYFNRGTLVQLPIQPVSVQEVGPGLYDLGYFKKEDRTQMCNLDRFVEATIPKGVDMEQDSVDDLIQAY